MPNYYVYLEKTQTYRVEVVASNKDDARRLVMENTKAFKLKKMNESERAHPYVETVEESVARNSGDDFFQHDV